MNDEVGGRSSTVVEDDHSYRTMGLFVPSLEPRLLCNKVLSDENFTRKTPPFVELGAERGAVEDFGEFFLRLGVVLAIIRVDEGPQLLEHHGLIGDVLMPLDLYLRRLRKEGSS